MRLTPHELDKLILHQAGFVAQKRLARGVRLNYPESVALISTQLMEFIRDGRSVSELMDLGRRFLGRADVLPGIPEMIHDVQVEAVFPDGSKLVTVHNPIVLEKGDRKLALYGSFLPQTESVLSAAADTDAVTPDAHVPGEFFIEPGHLTLNDGRATVEVNVINRGDRPIQVGSHYPFFETNRNLDFDRKLAFGMRLNIPAGTAARFEPGESKRVTLVALGGRRRVQGGNGWSDGAAVDEALANFERSAKTRSDLK